MQEKHLQVFRQTQVWMGRLPRDDGLLQGRCTRESMAAMQRSKEGETVGETHQVHYGTEQISGRGIGQARAMVDIVHDGDSHLPHANT